MWTSRRWGLAAPTLAMLGKGEPVLAREQSQAMGRQTNLGWCGWMVGGGAVRSAGTEAWVWGRAGGSLEIRGNFPSFNLRTSSVTQAGGLLDREWW